jgi:hypothetical protein
MVLSGKSGEGVLKATVLLGWLAWTGAAWGQSETCPQCDWAPPRTATRLIVRTMDGLREAVRRARPGTTVLIEDGVYNLDGVSLDITVPRVVLRGRNGPRSRALLRGRGMGERMVALSVSAPETTLADLTISQVGFHGIQVRGETGASGVVIHRVHILDVGQQLIKGSTAPDSRPCRDGLVACSTLEYTDAAPSDYTNGVDIINGQGWVVRDNVLRRIRGPRSQGYRAGPAILFWGGSRDTVVERNLLVDCYRGIALGLVQTHKDAPGGLDHQGGVIRRNALVNLNAWADEGIEVNASPAAQVAHNTLLVEGQLPWSIGIRFPTASTRVWNNLSNHPIVLRDGAKAELTANVITARRDWFVDPTRGDLRLARGDLPAVDAGLAEPRAGASKRAESGTPFVGKAPDAGAYEFRRAP